ncbi:hypothetical protein GH714_042145 [Hevea brasiliensis]|uniref:Bet v I/Major latex protein domain-containing protein n=1 Tax=Hevea brasiliensis TaxID=3981 RepID=A0A6A6MUF4_HEVBR|nr:hypothetical protein GH714_042145 [Hevea brasiliensis]
MALTGKLETEVEVKVAADKAYGIFRSQTHQLPNIASDMIHNAEIHEEGNVLSLKETIEKIDEENKSITYKVVDGDANLEAVARGHGTYLCWHVDRRHEAISEKDKKNKGIKGEPHARDVRMKLELNDAADHFYKIFYSEAHHVPNASDSIHSVEDHEGDWETPGSTKLWKYTLGNPEFFKEKVDVDKVNKTITFTAVEGHVLEQYKSYKAILQVIPKGDGGLVKICVEYEKLKADDPPPSKYLDILVSVVKDVDAHLVKA